MSILVPQIHESNTVENEVIILFDDSGVVVGGGVAIDHSAIVLPHSLLYITNALYCKKDEKKYSIDIIRKLPDHNLALGKVIVRLTEIPLKPVATFNVQIGEKVYYHKVKSTNEVEIVETKIHKVRYSKKYNRHYCTFVGEYEPGLSGSPLINSKGELIGLCTISGGGSFRDLEHYVFPVTNILK